MSWETYYCDWLGHPDCTTLMEPIQTTTGELDHTLFEYQPQELGSSVYSPGMPIAQPQPQYYLDPSMIISSTSQEMSEAFDDVLSQTDFDARMNYFGYPTGNVWTYNVSGSDSNGGQLPLSQWPMNPAMPHYFGPFHDRQLPQESMPLPLPTGTRGQPIFRDVGNQGVEPSIIYHTGGIPGTPSFQHPGYSYTPMGLTSATEINFLHPRVPRPIKGAIFDDRMGPEPEDCKYYCCQQAGVEGHGVLSADVPTFALCWIYRHLGIRPSTTYWQHNKSNREAINIYAANISSRLFRSHYDGSLSFLKPYNICFDRYGQSVSATDTNGEPLNMSIDRMAFAKLLTLLGLQHDVLEWKTDEESGLWIVASCPPDADMLNKVICLQSSS
ncbi:hypothetical protein BDN72DRAFT_843793 [Pluteus cervinus]|uniref:Uncharacterized protein n=1 Tax=Pluteus cervinus TaxID=181527 RepID=A0ACD3AMT1_9AGAR|nr:hypothetical protein BDN72DRAFT_843793 [Pluteus cervinus]